MFTLDDSVVIIGLCAYIFAVAVLSAFTLILKLTGAITWSWLWVLSPLWIGILFLIFVVGLITLYLLIFGE